MIRLARTLAASALLATTALLGGCDSSPTGLRTGQLTLLLTDAPGNIVKAVVTIERIYLQPSEDADADRVILRDEPVTTDLLTLAGTVQELIRDVSIPAGTYGQLRFVISGAYVEVEGASGNGIYASSPTYAGLPTGTTVTGSLMMPSFAQTGIKVTLPNDALVIGADDSVTLLVDFDVSQSFGQAAGASGMWVMTPVLTGTIPQ